MRIKKIHITNFKSLVDFELNNLSSFCAFVGPNASGKSNIFEALEFSNYVFRYSIEASSFFGGKENIYSFNPKNADGHKDQEGLQSFFYEFYNGIIIDFFIHFNANDNHNSPIGSIDSQKHTIKDIVQLDALSLRDLNKRKKFIEKIRDSGIKYEDQYEQFVDRFTRLFIGKSNIVRRFGSPPPTSYSNLYPDASNLSQTIGKIFENSVKSDDFIDWLTILIPEFSTIEIKKSNIDGNYDFVIYEKNSTKPFPRYLISDGTYNILSLMAAIYQSDQPQFICIEEPENGLHPYAIQLLIDFFREKCEKDGHTIWLNTHSQSLVRCLNIDEIILINKINGETKAKQLSIEDGININTDEAWLSNALGGGVLWSR